jgi:hypothetical protein
MNIKNYAYKGLAFLVLAGNSDTLSYSKVEYPKYRDTKQIILQDFKDGETKSEYSQDIEILKEKYGKNKIIPKEIEKVVLSTLSKHPELTNIPIEFKMKGLKYSMVSQPKIGSILFNKKQNHEYIIKINDGTKKNGGLTLDQLSESQRIGIISHELEHILDYIKFNDLQHIAFGFKYLFSKNFKIKTEHRIDEQSINRGFGKELHSYVNFSFNCPSLSKEYLKKKNKFYHKPKKIREFIQYRK